MELSTTEAAHALRLSDEWIRQSIAAGNLHARRIGIRGIFRIQLADLRKFAAQYNYHVDETYIQTLANRQ